MTRAAMKTTAVAEGDCWVLNGAKRWIGNATVGHVVIVWARAEDGIAGFIVELPNPGFIATRIDGKMAKRASWQADIELRDCRVPASARMPTGSGSAATIRSTRAMRATA